MRLRRAVEVVCFAPLGACATAVAAVRRRRSPSITAGEPGVVPEEAAAPVSAAPPPTSDRRTAESGPGKLLTGELPIEGYDHLAASQVVDRLDALTAAELAAVAAYERTHRHRQTVLARVAQLQT